MKNEYCCDLNDLLELFDEKISEADIIAAKALSEISSVIVKQRLDLQMTQKEFASYIGVSQGMVSKWESADYNFSVKSLAEIAAKLDLDLSVKLHKPKVIHEEIEAYSSSTYKSIQKPVYNRTANLPSASMLRFFMKYMPDDINENTKDYSCKKQYLNIDESYKKEWEVAKCYNM